MATPLAVKVDRKRVPNVLPSDRRLYSGESTTSLTDRNRVQPKAKTLEGKVPLETVKPAKANLNATSKPSRLIMASSRSEMPLTFKGMPKNRFRGKVTPNKPL